MQVSRIAVSVCCPDGALRMAEEETERGEWARVYTFLLINDLSD
jgi:hypothetical protein